MAEMLEKKRTCLTERRNHRSGQSARAPGWERFGAEQVINLGEIIMKMKSSKDEMESRENRDRI